MKFTGITEANAACFESVIGAYWQEQRTDCLFVGVVDEEEAAVGAAAWAATSKTLSLLAIGVDEKKRRKGFGTGLIRESKRIADRHGIMTLEAAFFGEEDLSENELALFFTHCGFEIKKAPVERQIYLLEDLRSEDPFPEIRTGELGVFCEGKDLGEDKKAELIRLSLDDKSMIPYLDTELFFSEENQFGGVLMDGEKILSAATIVPFEDGVRLDQLYGTLFDLPATRTLLKHCLERVRKDPKCKRLYLDVGGEKLLELQKKRFEKVGIRAEQSLQGYIARG